MKTEFKTSWILRAWGELKKFMDAEKEGAQMPGSCSNILLCWQPPEQWFTTLNVDGSVDVSDGRAGGGGVLRDETGGWKGEFLCRAHSLHATIVEAWMLMKGLEWGWRKGVRRLVIQSDSMEVFDLV